MREPTYLDSFTSQPWPDGDRPQVPIAVAMPVLPRRVLNVAEGGPVAYQVPGIRFEQGVSMFRHAVNSVYDQTVRGVGLGVAIDGAEGAGYGAGATRQRALDQALKCLTDGGHDLDASFVSFLDDDDLWYPHHLVTHHRLLTEGDGGDVAYSWFDGNEPFPKHRGRVFDPEDPHHTTMTITVRASLAREAGKVFHQPDGPMHQDWSGEDWQFILKLIELGARFVGTGECTWHYRVHYGNTSGLPTRGDAVNA